MRAFIQRSCPADAYTTLFLEMKKSAESSAIARAQEYGIDLTLLIENLRRSPTERLRRHQAMLEFVEEVRRAAQQKQEGATAGRNG